MKRILCVALALSAGFWCAGPLHADLVTWDDGDSNWNAAGNWSPAQIPNVNGADDAVGLS